MKDWQRQFGIDTWAPPNWFDDPAQLASGKQPVPQAHAIRRAFEELKLSGVLCLQNSPLVYFREVARVDAQDVKELHRRFWSQGLAPVLVLISPTDVYIYSGLVLPQIGSSAATPVDADPLVQRLSRIADAAELRQFVLSLESGDFFRRHSKAFNRERRVDRELLRNLKAAREEMERVSNTKLDSSTFDALLCRVIFSCYLFDRKIVDAEYLRACGIAAAQDLRGILALRPRDARKALYGLFEQLGRDFNGDLFGDDLNAERRAISDAHLSVMNRLLQGADVRTGQGSFWPYDFGVIPIETISAIYEHFLKSGDPSGKKAAGAFYTPRFLAEILLDLATEKSGSLLDKRFFDPACGSGIFLVGLFNRLAEEWKRHNPSARYDARANGMMLLLQRNLFGADLNPTACRITAFSLYLAFLDQLSPPDIRRLQTKGRMLPPLVFSAENPNAEGRSIFRGDFFQADGFIPSDFDLVVGNPPWMSATNDDVPFVQWCKDRKLPLPDRQSAVAFAWKAALHLKQGGRACLVLPHGVLFNHGSVAVRFQRLWLTSHTVELVLNLADFQRFLFEEAENPALVIRYRGEPATDIDASIRYLTPKTDWNIAHAELLTIYPQDNKSMTVREILSDLKSRGAPVIWKERYWGTPRDWKLLDRLRDFPMLGQLIGKPAGRWMIGQGFQKPGPSDGRNDRKSVVLPTTTLIEARHKPFELFFLPTDGETLPSAKITVRARSNTNTDVFKGPHVLVTDGFKVAFTEHDAAFRQSVRAIKGPVRDTKLLMFLSAYLNSPLARYYLFHSAANIGIERAKAEAGDVLRLPFPLPEDTPEPKRSAELVERAAVAFRRVMREGSSHADRLDVTRSAVVEMSELVYSYFDIDTDERALIEDTDTVLRHSARRKDISESIPTLRRSTAAERTTYGDTVCAALNDWAHGGAHEIRFANHVSDTGGMAVVMFSKVQRGAPVGDPPASEALMPLLDRLHRAFRDEFSSVEILRGLTIFERENLYVVKPLSKRFWTRTAALNDADEIAAAVLFRGTRATR